MHASVPRPSISVRLCNFSLSAALCLMCHRVGGPSSLLFWLFAWPLYWTGAGEPDGKFGSCLVLACGGIPVRTSFDYMASITPHRLARILRGSS